MKSKPGEYDYLPHTADAKFRAYGKTLEECFRNAGRAMTNIITDVTAVGTGMCATFELTAKTREALLFDFLDRLIYLLDTEGILFADARLKIAGSDGAFTLNCTMRGDHYKGYETHGDVKAVTYNDMELKREQGRWTAQVVVDL